MDFKESGFMYLLGGFISIFVIAQSLFFMIKAWKQGKKIGLSTSTLKNTITSSALFTIAPAIAILATVITIAGALGLVLPWIKLTTIGNISYEVTAAQSALEAFGIKGGLAFEVKNKEVFAAAAWVMTVGCVMPLILLPVFLKKIQTKVGKAANTNAKWADLMAAAAFIGLIAAFIAKAVAGRGEKTIVGDGAGLLSLSTLIAAMVIMVVLQLICNKFKLKWLESFNMPLSMIAAMGVAMLLAQVLPANLVMLEWRG
ncbi:MAG: DUF5058 family protein [Eubacteriales bacterium]